MGWFTKKDRSPGPQPVLVFATVPEQTEVVGVQHYLRGLEASLSRDERRELEVPITLELRAEPTNPHDPDAIGAYHRGEKIGHIPKRETRIYHPQLAALSPGEVLVVRAMHVVRGGRYVRVYSYAAPLPVPVGEPGPRLSFGNLRGQAVDGEALTRWFDTHADPGTEQARTVAQLAIHPVSPLDVVILFDGTPVAMVASGKRELVAREVREANRDGATLGAPAIVTRSSAGGWTLTLTKPST